MLAYLSLRLAGNGLLEPLYGNCVVETRKGSSLLGRRGEGLSAGIFWICPQHLTPKIIGFCDCMTYGIDQPRAGSIRISRSVLSLCGFVRLHLGLVGFCTAYREAQF